MKKESNKEERLKYELPLPRYETRYMTKEGGTFIMHHFTKLFRLIYQPRDLEIVSFVTVDRETGAVIKEKNGFRLIMQMAAEKASLCE